MKRTKVVNRAHTLIILILSLASAVPSMLIAPAEAAPSTSNVTISGFALSPRSITILKGDTIVWTNNDPVIHTLWFVNTTNQETYLLSPPILPGQSWSHTFGESISLRYYSFKYLWISGFVTVTPIIHNIAVTQVTPLQTQAIVGETVSINVTVENEGNVPETFNVTAYYDDTPIETKTDISLNATASTTLTFTWNTVGVTSGTYTIKAQASAVPGETDATDNTFINGQVTLSVHDIAVTQVTAAPTSVEVGEIVYVNVTAANHGNATETFDVTAYYDTSSIETRTDVSLNAGENTTLSLSWNTTGVTEGTYTISAEATVVPGEIELANNKFTDGTVTINPIDKEAPPFPTEYVIALIIVIAVIVGVVLYYYMKKRRSGVA